MSRVIAIALLVAVALGGLAALFTTTRAAAEYRRTGDAVVNRLTYGGAPSEFADLWLPSDPATGDRRVVVLIHGGFWRSVYGLDLMEPLAADLIARGFAVWNIEYRRVGEAGGGWPGTLTDVAAAIDHLSAIADEYGLDVADVAVIGHSAGGHLALWSAGRLGLPSEAPGADPVVLPTLAIGLGPVVDLAAADAAGLGDGAVREFLGGGPDEVPERYADATPNPGGAAGSNGPGMPVVMVAIRGERDTVVPPQYSVLPPDDPDAHGIEPYDVAGDDHFDLIDPTSRSWAVAVERLGAATT